MKIIFKRLFLFLLLPLSNAYALNLEIEPSLGVDFATGNNKNTTFLPAIEVSLPIFSTVKGGLGVAYARYSIGNSETLINKVNGFKNYSPNSIQNKEAYINAVPIYIFIKKSEAITDNINFIYGLNAGLSNGTGVYNKYELTDTQIAGKSAGDIIYQKGIVVNDYFYGAFIGISYNNIAFYVNYSVKNYKNNITYDKKLADDNNNTSYVRFSKEDNKKVQSIMLRVAYSFNY